MLCIQFGIAQSPPFEVGAVHHFNSSHPNDWDDVRWALQIEEYPAIYGAYKLFSHPKGALYDCILPDNGHWIGAKIQVLQATGHHIFEDEYGQPIRIQPEAQPGHSWVAWQEPTRLLHITCDRIVADTLLGEPDTIKILNLQMTDVNGNHLTHEINNMTLHLSQRFGYSRIINFQSFPDYVGNFHVPLKKPLTNLDLVGITSPTLNVGYQNLTWEEVVNFEIGDIFHVVDYNRYSLDSPLFQERTTYIIDKVLGKQITSDSFFYVLQRQTSTMNRDIDGNNSQWQSEDTLSVSHARQLAHFDPISGLFYHFDSDEASFNESRLTRFGSAKIFKYLSFYSPLRDSCYYHGTDFYIGSHFIKRGGGPYFSFTLFGEIAYRSLSYFENDSSSIGNPLDTFFTTTVSILSAKITPFKFYPNPAKNILEIKWNHGHNPLQIDIYSLNGNKVLSTESEGKSLQLSIQHLSPGIYFCCIQDKKRHSIVRRFIKI